MKLNKFLYLLSLRIFVVRVDYRVYRCLIIEIVRSFGFHTRKMFRVAL